MTDARPYGSILGRNISAARGRLQLSQGAVAARMRALGFPWQQQTAAAVEKAKRRPTAEEILGLALALETTISALMGGNGHGEEVLLPGGLAVGTVSVERLAGRGVNDRAITWHGNDVVMVTGMGRLPGVDAFDRELLARAGVVGVPGVAAQPRFTEAPDKWHPGPEAKPPIVAAIVTSELGVLVGKRRDGKPPWTFPAGEQDAVQDENPADTAVRETKEEFGLRIVAGDEIGRRVHPVTSRLMIYVAAAPTRGTDIIVGDEEELAEVRWVSLTEAGELLPGMYEPVRKHLEREIGGAEQ